MSQTNNSSIFLGRAHEKRVVEIQELKKKTDEKPQNLRTGEESKTQTNTKIPHQPVAWLAVPAKRKRRQYNKNMTKNV